MGPDSRYGSHSTLWTIINKPTCTSKWEEIRCLRLNECHGSIAYFHARTIHHNDLFLTFLHFLANPDKSSERVGNAMPLSQMRFSTEHSCPYPYLPPSPCKLIKILHWCCPYIVQPNKVEHTGDCDAIVGYVMISERPLHTKDAPFVMKDMEQQCWQNASALKNSRPTKKVDPHGRTRDRHVTLIAQDWPFNYKSSGRPLLLLLRARIRTNRGLIQGDRLQHEWLRKPILAAMWRPSLNVKYCIQQKAQESWSAIWAHLAPVIIATL